MARKLRDPRPVVHSEGNQLLPKNEMAASLNRCFPALTRFSRIMSLKIVQDLEHSINHQLLHVFEVAWC